MKGGPPASPTPPKRSAPDSSDGSPARPSPYVPNKMIVALAVRKADKWVSVDVKDTSKYILGKPTNAHWMACNATLRSMKPEVSRRSTNSTSATATTRRCS
eukprot:6978126-Prymnesium_polylepis.1